MNTDNCSSLQALMEVIKKLTGPEGCPWDQKQTPMTLADYLIEESHELVAAIRAGNDREVCEELGDVAFLLLFMASAYEKDGVFSLADALDSSRVKMINRHPHVFGDAHFENLDEQLKTWEEIKKKEHEQKGDRKGIFASLPASLPPLVKAYRINSKAARAGFTWPTDEEAEQQAESEWLEWLDASESGDEEAQKHELGDILFTLVEVGRRKGLKASEALDLAANRFLRRFSRMEELAAAAGREFTGLSLDEKDDLWNEAKAEETGGKATNDQA